MKTTLLVIMALASFALQSCTWMFVPPDEVPYKPTGWPGGGTWSWPAPVL